MADEVVKLCLALELGVEEKVLRTVAKKLSPEELKAMRKALEERVDRKYPARVQLFGGEKAEEWDAGYLI